MSNPNSIQGGRWDEFFRRKFNLKGGVNTPELAAEIIPTVPLPFDPEDRFLLQDRICFGRGSTVGLAGEFPRIVLQMPISSNKLGIVEGMFIRSTGKTIFASIQTFFTIGVAAVGTTSFRDTRWGPPTTSLPTGTVTSGSVAAIISAAPMFLQAVDDQTFIPLKMVLWPPPGSAANLVLESNVVASTLQITLFWREVILDPSQDG